VFQRELKSRSTMAGSKRSPWRENRRASTDSLGIRRFPMTLGVQSVWALPNWEPPRACAEANGAEATRAAMQSAVETAEVSGFDGFWELRLALILGWFSVKIRTPSLPYGNHVPNPENFRGNFDYMGAGAASASLTPEWLARRALGRRLGQVRGTESDSVWTVSKGKGLRKYHKFGYPISRI